MTKSLAVNIADGTEILLYGVAKILLYSQLVSSSQEAQLQQVDNLPFPFLQHSNKQLG
jgi:hypothetical protein